MNDVTELKEYMLLHARVQGLSATQYKQVVANINSDAEWVARWSAEARSHEAAGQLLDACRDYNLARFPYVDSPARQAALESCIGVFDRWRRPRCA